MKPRMVSLVLFFLAAATAQGSGTLFGLRNPGDGGRQLVSVDPGTGAIATISASISPPLPSASGVNDLDAAGHRFFFVATPAAESDARLYAVDTQSGAVLSSPAIAGSALAPIESLDYDAGETVLYALRNPGDGGRQLVRLDVSTGAVTVVSASIGVPNLGTPSGVSALDAAGNRYFFAGTPPAETSQRLYTLDTATGAVLGSPVVAGALLGLAYDAAEGKLFALRNPGDAGRQLVVLDPVTGAATAVSVSIAPPLGSSSGVVALDAGANHFFFVGTPSAETDARLYTVDTATGAVASSPVLTGSATAFFSGLEFAPAAPPPPVVLTVTIDIKPGGTPNSIKARSNGVIPVAILTTPAFDATTVDVSTVRFGPGNAVEAHGRGHVEDVDGDGDLDLVLHFRTQDAAIPCGATSATLTGATSGGQAITGTDSVKMVCK